MFPPLSCLFLLFRLLLCFPLRKLPLPFLALEKRLYLREQDTGQGFYLMVGYARTVVVGPLFPCHGIPPLELPFIEQVALEHGAVSRDEAAPRIFGNLVGGAGVVQDDLREHIVRPAAHPEIQVVLDLAGEDVGIRALGGKDKMDAKGPPQACEGGIIRMNIPFLAHRSITPTARLSLSSM